MRRHGLDLTRILHSWHPLDAFRSKQLGTGLRIVEEIHIVQDARLDDSHAVFAPEAVAIPEKRSSYGCDGLSVQRFCRSQTARWTFEYIPQSGQKQLVICLPVSAILEISFGVPCVTLKLALGRT